MNPNATTGVRIWLTTFAALLTFFGLWQITAEAIRPAIGYFPKNLAEAKSFASEKDAAGFAAAIGWPRGDLATEHLVASYSESASQKAQAVPAAAMRSDAVSAANLSPFDARPWLVLATSETDPSRLRQILKMSYYTAPANAALFSLRLQLAAQQTADDELRTLMEFETGILLQQNAGFGADIEAIYRSASPDNRSFIERLLKAADPAFLAALKQRVP